MTDRYAVVGNPVAHSLSPRIHTAFAEATGQAMTYTTLLAPPDGFAPVVESFFAAGGEGLNVTVPFKEAAAAWVTELDAAALAAGAVNAIARTDSGCRGYNTDGAGFIRDLEGACGVAVEGLRVLLLGAGGAACGVVRPLLARRPSRLVIANRTGSRASELADALRREQPASPVAAATLNALRPGFDLIVNATSAGLASNPSVVAVDPAVVYGTTCYDLSYADPAQSTPTAFCRWATEHGAARVLDGLGMLVEQAALSFQIWRGVLPPAAAVLERLRAGAV